MSEIKVIDNLTLMSSDTYAENFVKLTKLGMADISKKFFEIGFRLYEADANRYYKELGFQNISDCAEHYFGFKKTTTYDLMKIYQRLRDFGSNSVKMKLPEKYNGFSQTQLLIIASINHATDSFFAKCSQSDTVSFMKKAAKYWNKYYWSYYSMLRCCSNLQELVDKIEEKLGIVKAEPAQDEAENKTLPVNIEDEDDEDVDLDDADDYLSVQTENTDYSEPDDEEPEEEFVEVEGDFVEVSESEAAEEPEEELVTSSNVKIENMQKQLTSMLRLQFHSLFTNTPGISYILRDNLADKCCKLINDFLISNKSDIREILFREFSQFDYKVTLHGREQNLSVFCSNIASCLKDIFRKPEGK
ncbi:MAG: hypothetical protein IJ309_02390 [Clostridia bacterium]|nr:hypothetical protein [Clostridia bacterium]